MKTEDINYILYNNRSRNLVTKFLPKVDLDKFIELEKRFKFIYSSYNTEYEVGIKPNEIDISKEDILFDKGDISSLEIPNNIKKEHKDWLNNRGISDEIIKEHKIKSVDENTNKRDLDIMGVTIHPILERVFKNQNEGIIIPYYENGTLSNVICRRLIDGALKYTLAIPDVTVFGTISEEIWVVEGFFDYMALSKYKNNVVTVSSATWSTIQLYKLIENGVKVVNYVSDYDYTGIKTAQILMRFFTLYGIEFNCYISNQCKDMSEHFFEKKLSIEDIEETYPSNDLLDELKEDSKLKYDNFFTYLKNRDIGI